MKAGLIGEKLAHSFSPEIHEKFSALTGISVGYELFETQKNGLGDLLDKLERGGYAGANVTIPYKTDIMEHLDAVSAEASDIGAVNTVCFEGSKKTGYNTDYFGLKVLIDSSGVVVEGKKAVILGTGGAAKCARKLLSDLGADEIVFASRAPDKTGKYPYVSYAELESLPAIDVLINTTPVGMFPDNEGCPVSDKVLDKCGAVIDMIYNPPVTKLIAKARERGIIAAGGLWMLCAQAVKSEEIWNGRPFGKEIYRGLFAYMRRRKENANIVLIGMPGSGKTSAGKRAAALLGMPFADTDEMIERRHGNIPAIFAALGEAAFRAYEREAALDAAAMENTVVSTGGGIILDRRNMEALRNTGIIVFIDMPLETLLKNARTEGRPLLAGGTEAIERLYKERKPLYEAYADVVIDNSRDLEHCVGDLLKKLA